MKRTIRFATVDDDLSDVFYMAQVLGIVPVIHNDFYAVLTFPEPHDIIIISEYVEKSNNV